MAQLGPGRVERRPPVTMWADAPFQFACQGCGAFCCTNERLVLSPLEVRSLVRALGIDATDLSAHGWLAAFPDPDSGIPRVAVEFLPVRSDLTACPFLGLNGQAEPEAPGGTPALRLTTLVERQQQARLALVAAGEDGGRQLPLRCHAYAGRPIMCRSFPLQFKLELTPDGSPAGWAALAHTHCPGHGKGAATQTAGDYLTASGIAPLAAARQDWHRLNLAIAAAGITLQDHDAATGSRRALWDTTLNLLFAAYTRPRLQVADADYTSAITELFSRYLAPVGPLIDVEARAAAGLLRHADAAVQLRRLVAACQQVEDALDQPAPVPVPMAWPVPAG